MKKFYFAMVLFAAAMCFSFVACSDDDDNGDEQSLSGATLTIGDKSATFTYAYWFAKELSWAEGKVYYQVELYSCDYYDAMAKGGSSVPETYSKIAMAFIADGTVDELPVLTSQSDVETTYVYGAFDIANSSSVLSKVIVTSTGMYFMSDAEADDTKVQIAKSGGVYTLTINPLVVSYAALDASGSADFSTATTSFTFKGAFKEVPEEYREEMIQ